MQGNLSVNTDKSIELPPQQDSIVIESMKSIHTFSKLLYEGAFTNAFSITIRCLSLVLL